MTCLTWRVMPSRSHIWREVPSFLGIAPTKRYTENLAGQSTRGNHHQTDQAMPFANQSIDGTRRRFLRSMTAALVGRDGSRIEAFTDWLISVPSNDTPRIQEVHLIMLHLMAETIEEKLG